MSTSIEWTQETWNPTSGCTKVSPGCAHCYIERTPPMRMAGRKFVNGRIPLMLHADRLDKPLHWRKPKLIFVNSMSDLFHDDVPFKFIDQVVSIAAITDHTYQCLTKRSQRAAEYWSGQDLGNRIYQQVSRWLDGGECGILGRHWDRVHDLAGDKTIGGPKYDQVAWRLPLQNWWQGVSVENRTHGLPRIEHLLRTPAAVRFLSVEPLLEDLGRLDLLRLEAGNPAQCACGHGHGFTRCPNTGGISRACHVSGCGCPGFYRRPGSWTGIDWVIVGGESGPAAREMKAEWVQSVRDQCAAAGVPFFFKQWGEFLPPMQDGADIDDSLLLNCSNEPYRVGKKRAGRKLDGREWNEMPITTASVPS